MFWVCLPPYPIGIAAKKEQSNTAEFSFFLFFFTQRLLANNFLLSLPGLQSK
jgi:hypothetical protein